MKLINHFSWFLGGAVLLILAAQLATGHQVTHTGADAHTHTGAAIPSKLPSAKRTVREQLQRFTDKTSINIIALLPLSKLQKTYSFTANGNTLDSLRKTCATAGLVCRFLSGAIIVQEALHQSPLTEASDRKDLLTQFASSLTSSQLAKISYNEHDETVPTLRMSELKAEQVVMARRILARYGPTVGGKSSADYPPSIYRVRVFVQWLARIQVNGQEYMIDIPLEYQEDKTVMSGLESQSIASRQEVQLELNKQMWELNEIITLVEPSKRLVLDKSLRGLKIFVTVKRLSKSRLGQYLLKSLDLEKRELKGTTFIAASPRASRVVWSFYDRWRQAKSINLIDSLESGRNGTKRVPLKSLHKTGQDVVVRRFAEYQEANPKWKTVSVQQLIEKGTAQFTTNLNVDFIAFPEDGDEDTRKILTNPFIVNSTTVAAIDR